MRKFAFGTHEERQSAFRYGLFRGCFRMRLPLQKTPQYKPPLLYTLRKVLFFTIRAAKGAPA